MTKTYKILQRKLGEVESSIAHLSSLSPANTIPSDLLSDIAQQLVFSRKILSAEISSHPSKPHHLAHISHRLDRLDAALRRHQAHHDADDDDSAAVANGNFDAASNCSCTSSCLNDDGEGPEADLGSELIIMCGEEEPEEEMFYEAPGPEEEAASVDVGTTKTDKGGGEEEEEEEERDCVWGYIGFGGGLVVGAVLMGSAMLRFSDCFHYIQHEGFLVPT